MGTGAVHRVELAPGKQTEVKLHVDRRALSYWSDAQQKWVYEPDGRTVYVGDANAAANLPLQTTLKVPAKDKGDVTCSNEQINAAVIEGNLKVEKGDWCDLVDVTVNGDIHVDKSSGVRLIHVQVAHDVDIQADDAADLQSSGANVLCDTAVGHDLHIHGGGTTAPWTIGGCGPVTVGHDFHFDGNKATGNSISNATVQHDLSCSGNGAVSGSGNTAGNKKSGQCAGL